MKVRLSACLQSENFSVESGHHMRSILFAAIVLVASSANAQSIWQMNAAYQNQINQAQQSAAWPVYGYGYAPVYRPAYVAPRYVAPRTYGYYGGDFYRSQALFEQQRQTRELRSIDNTLQNMQLDMMFDD